MRSQLGLYLSVVFLSLTGVSCYDFQGTVGRAVVTHTVAAEPARPAAVPSTPPLVAGAPAEAKVVLTTRDGSPLPSTLPPGVQIAVTVENGESVVGKTSSAVKWHVWPKSLEKWSDVVDDGKTIQVPTGAQEGAEIRVWASVAYNNTVDDGEYVFIVETQDGGVIPDEPDPEPVDPGTGEDEGENKIPDLSKPALAIRTLADENIYPMTRQLTELLVQIGANFQEMASRTSQAEAGIKKYAALMDTAVIEEQTRLINQKVIGNDGEIRATLLPFFQALQAHLSELKQQGELATPSHYIEAWKVVAEGLGSFKD